MDKWVLLAQVFVFIGLAALVGCGKDSAVTDGLLAVSGSICGVGIWDRLTHRS